MPTFHYAYKSREWTPERLESWLASQPDPVLLLEGTRALPPEDYPRLAATAEWLARRLPGVRFRSGNADGSDTAFAEGVCRVAPERMEYVVPNAHTRARYRFPGARCVPLTALDPDEQARQCDQTLAASPNARRMVEAFRESGTRDTDGIRATYLIRDTLKVLGAPRLGLAPASAGLFYVNENDPLSGGTGHTVKVCLQSAVPVVMQADWLSWPESDRGTGRSNKGDKQ